MKKSAFGLIVISLLLGMSACQKDRLTGDGSNNGDLSDNGNASELEGFNSDGSSKYTYSVSSFKRVAFSRGNLQYQASTGTWRFAEHQYDCIGLNNNLISSVNTEWIDLFGWGTSGWAGSGAVAYMPYSTSNNDQDYYPGGEQIYDLVDEWANADWGVYAAVSNGGNKAGVWHTLNKNEWCYLLGQTGVEIRKNKWGMATIVELYKGLVILPDNWTAPSGVEFKTGARDFSANNYTDAEWRKMEAAGAIFLPATGRRHSTGIDDVGVAGYYWATTHYNENRAYNIYFESGDLDMVNRNFRSNGLSVRLVKTK